MFEWLRKKL